MARWLYEEQATMNAGILNVTVTLSSQFLSEVCRMLIFDVFHNRIPAVNR